jgi:hypothetical protein
MKTVDNEFILAVENINTFSVEFLADSQKYYRETSMPRIAETRVALRL